MIKSPANPGRFTLDDPGFHEWEHAGVALQAYLKCAERDLRRLCEAVDGLTVGSPEDPANRIGPVIDAAAKERILATIESGRREGKVAAEIPVPGEGYYVSPTVLTDLPPDSKILREEIFGPVLAVIRAGDIEEAVGLASSSPPLCLPTLRPFANRRKQGTRKPSSILAPFMKTVRASGRTTQRLQSGTGKQWNGGMREHNTTLEY